MFANTKASCLYLASLPATSGNSRERGVRQGGEVDIRSVGHPHLSAAGGQKMGRGVNAPGLLANHDGMGENLCVEAGGDDQVVHGGAAAVHLPQGAPSPVGHSDLAPRALMDGEDGNGVLVEPTLFAPHRQHRLLVVDRGERGQRMRVLLSVSPLYLCRAAL